MNRFCIRYSCTRLAAASGLLLAGLAIACNRAQPSTGSPAPSSPAPSFVAGIEILEETGTTMSVRFTDSTKDTLTLDFVRPDPTTFWRLDFPLTGSGFMFGEVDLVLPSVKQIQKQQLDPNDYLKTFDSSIALASADEISIYSIGVNAIAIAVWEGASVRRVHLAGTGVVEVFNQDPEDIERVCEKLRIKCLENAGAQDSNGNGTIDCVEVVDLSFCELVAQRCPDSEDIDVVCDHLVNLCECGPGDEDDNLDACKSFLANCPPPPPDPNEDIIELLELILNLLQEILDMLIEQQQID